MIVTNGEIRGFQELIKIMREASVQLFDKEKNLVTILCLLLERRLKINQKEEKEIRSHLGKKISKKMLESGTFLEEKGKISLLSLESTSITVLTEKKYINSIINPLEYTFLILLKIF